MSLPERLERAWYGPSETTGGGTRLLLASLERFYRLGLAARELFFSSGLAGRERLPAPCISVGNLVAGGTGKTPVVSWIVELLLRNGLRPAVISRGYGGTSRGPERVPGEGGAAAARRFGDEPVMLARRHRDVPVVIGRDRPAAGREAVRVHGANVLVADDAFQHRRMKREMDIVVIDAGRWFGNGRLLPAGPLREDPAALSRAAVVLLNRISAAGEGLEGRRAGLIRLAPGAFTVEADVVPAGWRSFDGGAGGGEAPPPGGIHAFCGLGNPGSFRRTLSEMTWELKGWRAFPDHHRYSVRELERLGRAAAAAGASSVVTTEKDAVRIGSWPGPLPLYVLEVRLEIVAGRDALERLAISVAGRTAP